MAKEAVDRAVELLRDHGFEGAVASCVTGTRPLWGGGAVADGPHALGDVELAPDVEAHLRRSYGARAALVVGCMTDTPARGADDMTPAVDLSSRIDPELPYVWGEVLHAARHERVVEVEDALRRRIPIFRDARDQGLSAAPRAAAIIGQVLGWSAERRARSLGAYGEAVARSRAWMAA
jgi:glycerol-3-phosphate dehydrogenase